MSAVQEQRETISTYLDPADAALLRSRARAAERSIAAEMRVALREAGYLPNNASGAPPQDAAGKTGEDAPDAGTV